MAAMSRMDEQVIHSCQTLRDLLEAAPSRPCPRCGDAQFPEHCFVDLDSAFVKVICSSCGHDSDLVVPITPRK